MSMVVYGSETWSPTLKEEHRMRMKNGVFGMLRRVALVRTDVSEELSVSFIRVKIICELGTTLAATC
jgi:hypothetical protein